MAPHEVRIQSNKVSETRTNVPTPVISAVFVGDSVLLLPHPDRLPLGEVKNSAMRSRGYEGKDTGSLL